MEKKLNLVHIAWRNLGRNRTRTVISLLAVAVGVAIVVLAKATVDGMIDSLINNSIMYTSGHIRVIDSEYRAKERLLSLEYPVDGFEGGGYREIVDSLGEIDGVDVVSPRIRFGAMASAGEDTEPVMGIGVDPEAEEAISRISRLINNGRFLDRGDVKGAVVGTGLMQDLGLGVGDKFTLVFNTAYGSLRGYAFEIVGEISSGLQYLDDKSVYIPLNTAHDMLEMPDSVTEILVNVKDRDQTPDVLKQIESAFAETAGAGKYAAIPWYKHNELIEYIMVAQAAYALVYLFILFLASFVVVNTMVMVVNERTREIGTLGALGFRPFQVSKLFLYEGAIVGLLGSAIGAAIGAVVVYGLSLSGIPLGTTENISEDIMLSSTIYPAFNGEVLVLAFVAGFLVTVFSVFWPSRKAAGLDPTQALRAL